MYNLGARKVIVSSVGRIGCIPYQLARYNRSGGSQCNEDINNAIALFNTGLKKLVDRFNNGQLPSSKFVFLDSFQTGQDLAINAPSYGNIYHMINRSIYYIGDIIARSSISSLPEQVTSSFVALNCDEIALAENYCFDNNMSLYINMTKLL